MIDLLVYLAIGTGTATLVAGVILILGLWYFRVLARTLDSEHGYD